MNHLLCTDYRAIWQQYKNEKSQNLFCRNSSIMHAMHKFLNESDESAWYEWVRDKGMREALNRQDICPDGTKLTYMLVNMHQTKHKNVPKTTSVKA